MPAVLDTFRNPPVAGELDVVPQAILPNLPMNPDGAFNNLLVNNLTIVAPMGSTGLTISENLLFSPDNTFDIGSSSGSKPKNLWVGSQIASTTLAFWGGGGTISATNTPVSAIQITNAGLQFIGDNLYDIGSAVPGNSPRSVYAATSMIVGSSNRSGPAGFIYFQHPSGTNTSTLAQYIAASGLIILGGSNVPNIRLAYSAASAGGIPAFQAGDHYVVANATGDIHLSSLGPAS